MNNPCPHCGLADGFHDEKVHGRITTPPEALRKRHWQVPEDPPDLTDNQKARLNHLLRKVQP
jgi:hypothetical protein